MTAISKTKRYLMQTTHETDGDGLIPYPDDVKVTPVNVYMHSSGMTCKHDYSCPVCRDNHAILDLSWGAMAPCWDCQEKGFGLIKRKKINWLQKALLNIIC